MYTKPSSHSQAILTALSRPGHFIQDLSHLSSLGRDHASACGDVCGGMFIMEFACVMRTFRYGKQLVLTT